MNLTGLKDAPVDIVLDDGVYNAEITKAIFENSRQKGTLGLSLQFRVVSGTAQKNGDTPENRVLFHNIWFSEKTTERALSDTKKLIIAAGIDLDTIDEADFDPGVLVGRVVEVTTRQKTDEYGTKAEIKKFQQII